MRIAVAGLISILVTCGAASAADPAVDIAPDVNPERFGWTGFYVGASAGYAWLKDVDNQFPVPLHDEGDDWVFGAHAGYLHGFGNFVVGAEVEAMRLDINYELLDFIKVNNSVALKARAGYAIDRFLITGHAGGVYATTNVDLKDWGWVAGAGVDYALTDNVTVGGQYSHFGFDDFDGTQIDAKVDVLTARVGVKF
ncbi:outer membrane immunogenic protein [Mesorhizobium albiziae]|uniref:Outer membrane immunogenic protein n=1 Tax=Neomesorhizobium albiziae TaxID=335020 RepID=A0A1I4FDE3_9HYPH|nr:outer membrane beta-barrel protein [Mesorhizobium albiziae]GLS32542.1 porin [Mesorhizobium albiziae]SFL15918.1 outer membrane immunogenic protein [Mesorhizobium albiziae]